MSNDRDSPILWLLEMRSWLPRFHQRIHRTD